MKPNILAVLDTYFLCVLLKTVLDCRRVACLKLWGSV